MLRGTRSGLKPWYLLHGEGQERVRKEVLPHVDLFSKTNFLICHRRHKRHCGDPAPTFPSNPFTEFWSALAASLKLLTDSSTSWRCLTRFRFYFWTQIISGDGQGPTGSGAPARLTSFLLQYFWGRGNNWGGKKCATNSAGCSSKQRPILPNPYYTLVFTYYLD